MKRYRFKLEETFIPEGTGKGIAFATIVGHHRIIKTALLDWITKEGFTEEIKNVSEIGLSPSLFADCQTRKIAQRVVEEVEGITGFSLGADVFSLVK